MTGDRNETDAPVNNALQGAYAALHNHGSHSDKDGLAQIRDMVAVALADRQPAIAVTDHGTLSGTYPLWEACREIPEAIAQALATVLIDAAQRAGVDVDAAAAKRIKPGKTDPVDAAWVIATKVLTDAEIDTAIETVIAQADETGSELTLGTVVATARAVVPTIKPVMGTEAYLAIGSRHNPQTLIYRDPAADSWSKEKQEAKKKSASKTKAWDEAKDRYMHLTLLAYNEAGWANLLDLQRLGWDSKINVIKEEYQPLIDFDLLAEHNEGLLCFSGCMSGPVLGPLVRGDEERAEANLDKLVEIFGTEHLYVEVMEHGIAWESAVMPRLVELAKGRGLRVAATNDSHYLTPADHAAHSAWLAAKDGKTVTDPTAFAFDGDGYHFTTGAEMHARRDETWWKDACAETVRIADRIADDVTPFANPQDRIPNAIIEDGCVGKTDAKGIEWTAADVHLHHLIVEGAKERYGTDEGGRLPQKVRDRLNHEFGGTIRPMHFSNYFLVVKESIDWAREQGIAVSAAGRGSCVSSAVAYCLGITGVDPIRHDLIFERFLEPGRKDFPDIDTDFEAARRDEVITHLMETYGADNVARIGALSTAKVKKAIEVATKAAGLPKGTDKVLKDALPKHTPTKFWTLDEVRAGRKAHSPEVDDFFRALASCAPETPAALRVASALEGMETGKTAHACGVVVSDLPIVHMVPLRSDVKKDKKREERGLPPGAKVAEYPMKTVEKLRLLKLDCLGLTTLDILKAAEADILQRTGECVSPYDLPDYEDLGDPRVRAAWDLLGEGDSYEVFQFASQGMTELLKRVKPHSLDHLAAIAALYRPGPMAAGEHERYAHMMENGLPADYTAFTSDPTEAAVLDGSLGRSHSTLAFQEQVMALSRDIAGFDTVEQTTLRKAFSKKDRAKMATITPVFRERALAGAGLSGVKFRASTIDKLLVAIEGSSEYLFGLAHATGYAKVAWDCAFYKANYPASFGVGLLRALNNPDKVADPARRAAAVAWMASKGVTVTVPDVNTGQEYAHSLDETTVVLGLRDVKSVSEASATDLIADRKEHGQFTTLADAETRAPSRDTNERRARIAGGLYDAFGTRKAMSKVASVLGKRTDLTVGCDEWDAVERALREHAVTQTFTSGHPMLLLHDQVRQWRQRVLAAKGDWETLTPLRRMDRLDQVADGTVITVVGLVTGKRDFGTAKLVDGVSCKPRKGHIEDGYGQVEWTAWADKVARFDELLTSGTIVTMEGKVTTWTSLRTTTVTTTDEDGNEVEEEVEQEYEARQFQVFKVARFEYTPLEATAWTPDLGVPLSAFGGHGGGSGSAFGETPSHDPAPSAPDVEPQADPEPADPEFRDGDSNDAPSTQDDGEPDLDFLIDNGIGEDILGTEPGIEQDDEPAPSRPTTKATAATTDDGAPDGIEYCPRFDSDPQPVDALTVACDGASYGKANTNAGWAWVSETGEWAAGAVARGTNQRTELMAMIQAIRDHLHVVNLTVQTDSEYAQNHYTKWMDAQRRRGWVKGDGSGAPVSNADLIEQMIEARDERKAAGLPPVTIVKVKAHLTGKDKGTYPLNEAADEKAVKAKEKARDGRVGTWRGGPGIGTAYAPPFEAPEHRRAPIAPVKSESAYEPKQPGTKPVEQKSEPAPIPLWKKLGVGARNPGDEAYGTKPTKVAAKPTTPEPAKASRPAPVPTGRVGRGAASLLRRSNRADAA